MTARPKRFYRGVSVDGTALGARGNRAPARNGPGPAFAPASTRPFRQTGIYSPDKPPVGRRPGVIERSGAVKEREGA